VVTPLGRHALPEQMSLTMVLGASTFRPFGANVLVLAVLCVGAVLGLGTGEGWTRERLRSATRTNTEQTVLPAQKVPVHLLYWTAWADADGTVHFRRDVYDRDGAVRSALNAPLRRRAEGETGRSSSSES
jgi:hypothetical protein